MRLKSFLLILISVFFLTPHSVYSAQWSDDFGSSTAQQDWGDYMDLANLDVCFGTAHTSATVTNNRYELHIEPAQGIYEVLDGLFSTIEYNCSNAIIQGRIQEITDGDNFKAGLILRFNGGAKEAYALMVDSSANTIEISNIRAALGDSCNQYGGIYYESIQYNSLAQAGIDGSLTEDCQLKFKAEDQDLYGKVWATGTSEPEDWNIHVKNLDYAVNSGNGGVLILNNPGTDYTAQAAFDDIVFTTEEPAPPEITEITIGTANLSNYLMAYDHDTNQSGSHLPGLWIEPGQLSSTTSDPPPYSGICIENDATMYGKQKLGFAFILCSVPSEINAFYESCFNWHKDLPYNENPVHSFYGNHLGPSNKARCNLSGTPAGTSVSFKINMKHNIPHGITVNSNTIPQVSYNPSGYNGAGELLIEATTCQSTTNNGWTIPDSITSVMIYTNPAYGDDYLGVIGHTDHWFGDTFIFVPEYEIPGYEYNYQTNSGKLSCSNTKSGFTIIGPKGESRNGSVFIPDKAIDTLLGPGITNKDLTTYMDHGFFPDCTRTYPVTNAGVVGTLAEATYTFNSPVTFAIGAVPNNLMTWQDKLIADFGQDDGIYAYGSGTWDQLTSWGDANNFIEWDNKLVVDFGQGRGFSVYDGSSWTQLSGWDTVADMLVWNNGSTENLVVDFGQDRGLSYHDGTSWHELSGWDSVAEMMTWGNRLVVDFGSENGLYYYDSSWHKLSDIDSVADMLVWNDGSTENLVVDFGNNLGLYSHNGTSWTKLAGWDSTSNMLAWNSKLAVDFGNNRGLFTYDATNQWQKLTGWDNAAGMITWDNGSLNNLVVDFGNNRGLFYHNGSAWAQLAGWDDTYRMMTWCNKLTVDFGDGRGIYYYDTQWHDLAGWDETAKLIESGTDLCIDFGSGKGIFTNNGTDWNQLSGWSTAD